MLEQRFTDPVFSFLIPDIQGNYLTVGFIVIIHLIPGAAQDFLSVRSDRVLLISLYFSLIPLYFSLIPLFHIHRVKEIMQYVCFWNNG